MKFQKILTSLKLNFKFSTSTNIYSKIRVTRLPTQSYTLFVQQSTTMEQFKYQINQTFKNIKLCIIDHMEPNITLPQKNKQKQIYNKINDQETMKLTLLDSLLSDYYSFYDLGQNNQIRIALGVQIIQANQTNNLNIPDYIVENIIELNQSWHQQMTLQQALTLPLVSIKSEEQLKSIKTTCADIIFQLQQIRKILEMQVYNYGKSTIIVQRVLLFMIIKWFGLFYITYGAYGWDTGQPLAYLLNLVVDLIAMIKLFEFDNSIDQWGEAQYKHLLNIGNIQAKKRMLQWRLGHLLRKI